MATLSFQVASSTDDARNLKVGGSYVSYSATDSGLIFGKDASGETYAVGWRFTGITIPQGATVSSATIALYGVGSSGSGTVAEILYGQAADNAATFSSGSPPNTRTTTSASTSLSISIASWPAGVTSASTFDVTSIIQEIINRAGWVSGNALALLGFDNGSTAGNTVTGATYDQDSANAASLTITFTTATFGKTDTGSSSTLYNANRKLLSQATLTENAKLVSLSTEARASNTTEVKHFKGVIYADTSGAPGALVATTSEGTLNDTTASWRTANFAGESLAAGTYWIGVIHDGDGTTNYFQYRDNTTGLMSANTDSYSDGPSDPAGTMSTTGGPAAVYVTYTPDTAGSVTFSAAVQSLTSSQPAPTVTTTRAASVTAAAQSLTASAPTVQAGDLSHWKARIQAWIYPGPPAENANVEYSDGRVIYALKPEYYHVQADGTLKQLIDPTDGKNAYNAANAADVLAHCTEAFVTVSADAAAMDALTSDPTKSSDAISTLTGFCVEIGFAGVELDWEGFGSWTATSYANYKAFVEDFATSLHDAGKKLIIDGPPIGNATEQGYYQWKYEDFDASAADYIAVMAYDYEYDYGAGSAVSPNAWVTDICTWVKGKLTDTSRIIIGMPSYGYSSPTGSYTITILTEAQAATMPGFATATRDPDSYEMQWTDAGTFYCYQDSTGLDSKRQLIEDQGITNISVWHLGGNEWFSSAKAEPVITPSVPTDPVFSPAIGGLMVGQYLVAASTSAAGDVTAHPSAQTATVTSPAPTIATTRSVTVGVAAQSSTASVPSPSVTATQSVTVSPGALSASGSAPAASASATRTVSLTPSAQSTTTSAPAPSVATSRVVTLTPANQSATASQPAPSVSATRTVSVAAAAVTGTATAPSPGVTTEGQVTVAPSAQSAAASVPSATASASRTVSVAAISQTTTASTPAPSVAVQRQVTISASSQSTSSSQASPAVTATRTVGVTPASQRATSSSPSASVSTATGTVINPAALAATASAPSSTVATTRNVSLDPDVLSVTGSAPTSTILAQRHATAFPAAQTALSQQPAPGVVAQRVISVAVGVGSMSASQPGASSATTRSVTVAPPALPALSSIPAASIFAQRQVSLAMPSLAVVASQMDPTVTTRKPGAPRWSLGSPRYTLRPRRF